MATLTFLCTNCHLEYHDDAFCEACGANLMPKIGGPGRNASPRESGDGASFAVPEPGPLTVVPDEPSEWLVELNRIARDHWSRRVN